MAVEPLDFPGLRRGFLGGLGGKRPNTLRSYGADLDRFAAFLAAGGRTLDRDALSAEGLADYARFLGEGGWSDNSTRRLLSTLRAFLDHLVGLGVVPENPLRGLRPPPKFLPGPRPPPPADVRGLWRGLCGDAEGADGLARLTALRNRTIFLLVYGAGLRTSDLAGLREDRLLLAGGEPRVLLAPPGRDPHSVPLPGAFRGAHGEYRALLRPMKRRAALAFDHVLFNANPFRILSGGMSPRGVEMVFQGLGARHGTPMTPRSLRQACVFKWLAAGHPDGLVREWLGVAPSHSLAPYREALRLHRHDEGFLPRG